MTPTTTVESLGAELTQGRWLIVADTLDAAVPPARISGTGWLDFLLLAAEKKYMLGLVTLITAAVVMVFSLLLPNTYSAETQIMPPSQARSAVSSMLGPLGDLASLAGRDLLRNPGAVYVALLHSRTISDRLITRFNLTNVYGKKLASNCRVSLASLSQIEATKEGLIIIRVEDHDPQRAADLANAYAEELTLLTEKLAVSEAAQRRLFFEKQVFDVRDQLTRAEDALRHAQESTGMLQPDAQSKAVIEAAAALKVRIVLKETELHQLENRDSSLNPERTNVVTDLSGLRMQLNKLENSPRVGNGVDVPVSQIPETGLEYMRRLRDVKYYEAMFEMLSKQLEVARIDEAKEGAPVQVVDAAEPPIRKSGPHRTLLTALGGFCGFVFSLLWLAAGNIFNRAQLNPEIAAKLAALRHGLSLNQWRTGTQS